MSENRIIKEYPIEHSNKAESFFEGLVNMNLTTARPKLLSGIEEAKQLVLDTCKIGLVYERLSISSFEENKMRLSSGHTFCGETLQQIFRQGKELFAFVACLENYVDNPTQRMKVDYFVDIWGSAYLEVAMSELADEIIGKQLIKEGLRRTSLWCPGQHSIELENQHALFDLLKPEDIGCVLTPQLTMHPIKSASGLIGIIPANEQANAIPCDWCPVENCSLRDKRCPFL